MTGQKAAQDFAAQLFGVQPQPEPEPSSDETEAKDAEQKPEVEAGPNAEVETESDPVEDHRKLLVDLFRGGGAAKREADRKFFESLSGPTREGE